MEIIKKSKHRRYTFLMWMVTIFLVVMLFKTENAWTQPSIARTVDSYAWDMTDAAMDSVCQLTFDISYQLATWEQVVAYVQDFGLDDFYTQTGMTEYQSNGWLKGFYSSSRRYFAERHDGIVPSGWLVHAQIGNHDIDLGSWYNSRPILCYSLTSSNCGDGIVDSGEECDDGNNFDGDGCSATCILEATQNDGGGGSGGGGGCFISSLF